MNTINEGVLEAKLQQRRLEEAEFSTTPEAQVPNSIMKHEMINLHQNLESLLPDIPQKILQFLCSQSGEGVSTIVREYAWIAAETLGKSVLIIDANRNGGQKKYFGLKNKNGWDDAAQELVTLEGAITRIGCTSLYVSGFSSRPAVSSLWKDSSQIKSFFEKVRPRFDLVLIDSAPTTIEVITTFNRSIDGVVLVVEAEKTRWPVVENVKSRLIKNGNRVLGLVMNKRRNHIPGFIYTRL